MQFTELSFALKSNSTYNVDWFWANHLRGFLGMKLKKIFCIQKGKPCSKCTMQGTCPFYQMYELEDKNWRISPPEKESLQQDDVLTFKIILWSQTVNYALHIIKVMEYFKTKQFQLVSVKNFDHVIYENEKILSQQLQIKDTQNIPVSKNKLILHLRTPLRIKRRKKLVTQIDDKNIADVFGIKPSQNIRVTKIFERWIDFQRFSHRQKTSMRLGGLIGKYELFDPEGQLTSHLASGQVLGLGKAKTFGFGDIHIHNIRIKDIPVQEGV